MLLWSDTCRDKFESNMGEFIEINKAYEEAFRSCANPSVQVSHPDFF